jgi:hypothetical protein
MNRREKTLALLVGLMALVFAGYFGIKTLLLKPLQETDRQTQLLRDKFRQINDERRAFFAAEDFLKGMAKRTFGRDPDTATAQAGKLLTDLILRIGLRESEFTRLPVGPRKLKGAQEVGWNLQGEGPLPRIIDLLFLLEQAPQLHRIEGLVISAGDRSNWIKARFRYLTLVIDSAPEVAPAELAPKFTLASPERRHYDAIAQRDLLRPYVRRPDHPGPYRPSVVADQNAPRPEMLKVVSLSQWQGAPEAHIMDLVNMKVLTFKPGDTLLDGQIVMIDYRQMPMPGKPGLASFSRLILKIGSAYWAVEHGQTLADKYQLGPEALPQDLTKL